MQLTADQLGQILRTLVAPATAGHPSDKRRAPRTTVPFEGSILLLSDGEKAKARPVQIRDVSPRGLSFTYPVVIGKGQQFILLLPDTGGRTTRILGVVVHQRRMGQLFRMGAEIVCAMGQDVAPRSADTREMDRIRNSMLQGDGENAAGPEATKADPVNGQPVGAASADQRATPDKRRASRTPQIGQVTIVPFDGGVAGPAAPVRLEELSCRGLCVLHNQPFGVGSQFVARLTRKGDQVVAILCNTVHCERTSSGRFRIGAEFVESLGIGPLSEEPQAEADLLENRIRSWILAEEPAV